jgi:lipoprotein signal peptidase
MPMISFIKCKINMNLNDMIIIIGYYLILSDVVIESNKENKSSSPRLILILYKSESNIERS